MFLLLLKKCAGTIHLNEFLKSGSNFVAKAASVRQMREAQDFHGAGVAALR